MGSFVCLFSLFYIYLSDVLKPVKNKFLVVQDHALNWRESKNVNHVNECCWLNDYLNQVKLMQQVLGENGKIHNSAYSQN